MCRKSPWICLLVERDLTARQVEKSGRPRSIHWRKNLGHWRLWVKSTATSLREFVKSWPSFKIRSLSYSTMNLHRSRYEKTHRLHTLNLLRLHRIVKYLAPFRLITANGQVSAPVCLALVTSSFPVDQLFSSISLFHSFTHGCEINHANDVVRVQITICA